MLSEGSMETVGNTGANRGSDRDPGIQTGGDQPGTFWEPGTRTGRDVSQRPESPEPNEGSDQDIGRPTEPDEKALEEFEKGRRDREERNEKV